ncbi:hypothetical protein AAFC00_002441 [Neodothiora populina]|uniref:N-acetyltransferase domain-containing protein n=1 Tax=Neodothiora populina TaxID=2781224 RepID=A0ABR3P7E3_9PEZI
MPRDLAAERDRVLNDLPMLEKSEKVPVLASSKVDSSDPDSRPVQRRPSKDKIERDMDKQDAWAEIKPYTKSLTPSDVDSSVKLEDAAFPPHERASREKFLYRYTRCGEICLGLFTSARTDSDELDSSLPTASVAQTVSSDEPERKSILLAHCVATKTANPAIRDDDMEIPPNWQQSSKFSTVGHNDAGRTVCIHSLAVLPAYHGKGLGSTLLKAYIQRIEQSGIADRIALLAHGSLVRFYEIFGFVSQGPSQAQFGGGGWFDMVLELNSKPY